MGEGGRVRGTSRLKEAARKVVAAAAYACGSFSGRKALVDPAVIDASTSLSITISGSSVGSPAKSGSEEIEEETAYNNNSTWKENNDFTTKNLCAICLDALNYNSMGSSSGHAIFTAQCSHAFHFACISSNVHHGSVTCPICRAHWTQLPRNLNKPSCHSSSCNQSDPILRILDDSIANFRVHRRSFLRSARYDDDDPVEPDHAFDLPRLIFSLIPIPSNAHACFRALQLNKCTTSPCHQSFPSPSCSSSCPSPSTCHTPHIVYPQLNKAYLSVRLGHERATDMVLVASPNGPHLRLLKQSMAMVVSSLRHIDRLAIVTYSSAAARVFPLRRMTPYGKKTAVQVIDRLFYMGQADPVEGLKKGVKILDDRMHRNPRSCILHLSDNPTQPHHAMNIHFPTTQIHRFHVGFGFGTTNGFVMHEFEEFLARMLGTVVRELQLRISGVGDEVTNNMIIRVGELRGNEERRLVLDLANCAHVSVRYSYLEGDGEDDDCISKSGETLVSLENEEKETTETIQEVTGRDMNTGGRTSCAETWDFHDPYMARRWAKHLHGYRL